MCTKKKAHPSPSRRENVLHLHIAIYLDVSKLHIIILT